MSTRISSERISSFVGNTLPVWLISDTDLRHESILWRVEGNAHIREYKDARGGFNYGVIVTLDGVGEAVITAEYNGEKYEARIDVREKKRTKSGRLNYYIGDFHDHTSRDHKTESFTSRTTDLPSDYLNFLKEENLIDFSVISDHGDVIDAKCFFDGFVATEEIPMDTVIFPGSESEITLIERDRFGIAHKNSGEIVVTNADNFSAAGDYGEFCRDLSTSDGAICILAHPQTIGPQMIDGEKNIGIWNFDLERHNDEEFKKHIKGVETGNGTIRASNIANELVYSLALDAGFKVSTTSSSDNHNPPWGFYGFPGKTIIMAEERSKEAFLDALENMRFYSSDSGNVKVYYTVNGYAAPTELPLADSYLFHVELGYFRDEPETKPYKCQLISDGGRVIHEELIEGRDCFDFTIASGGARWFYLRLIDRYARKTLSVPTFTSRSCTLPKESLKPISKESFTAHDYESGTDCTSLLNENPRDAWESDRSSCKIIIDMKKTYKIAGLGHYPPVITKREGVKELYDLAKVANAYEVLTSVDGKNYAKAAEGMIRTCGGETVIRFDETEARYLAFTVRCTLGTFSEYAELKGSTLTIGELTPFERE